MNKNTETVNDELNKQLPALPDEYRWRVEAAKGNRNLVLWLEKKKTNWLGLTRWVTEGYDSFDPERGFGVYSLNSVGIRLYDNYVKTANHHLVGVTKV